MGPSRLADSLGIIANQKGFDVIMESLKKPVIMEAEYGKGKFVMMALAPDK